MGEITRRSAVAQDQEPFMPETSYGTALPLPSLSLWAVPRQIVEAEALGSDVRVQLLSPRYRDPLLKRFVVPRLPDDMRWDRYPLDTRGSRIWRLVDGRRTVAELIWAYRRMYPEDHTQISERIGRFLLSLKQHGFIDVA
jgi:hypothetical protein